MQAAASFPATAGAGPKTGRGRERLLYTPACPKASPQRACGHAEFARPINEQHGPAACGEPSATTLIPVLLCTGGPATVRGTPGRTAVGTRRTAAEVPEVVVDALNRMLTRRRRPHIQNEGFAGTLPTSADGDPAAAVIRVRAIARVVATMPNVGPTGGDLRATLTMRRESRSRFIAAQATAGLDVASFQQRFSGNDHLAAVAVANPAGAAGWPVGSRFGDWVKRTGDQSAEAVAGQIGGNADTLSRHRNLTSGVGEWGRYERPHSRNYITRLLRERTP